MPTPKNEWQEQPAPETGKKAPKQPYFIRRLDHAILAMAGLYELWCDPTHDDDPQAWSWTVTVLTTNATNELGCIHLHDPMCGGECHVKGGPSLVRPSIV